VTVLLYERFLAPLGMTKTLLEVLQSMTAYLAKHHIENPRLNAEHLIAHVLKMSRLELYLEFETKLNETELAQLRQLVKRRGQGEPLQHLLGTVEFCGQTFAIDQRAMVPRPETEELCELVVSEVTSQKSAVSIVDVGTGSGIIALSLAKQFPEAKVFAVDISEDALALAKENAARLDLSSRVTFLQSNLLEDLTALGRQVSNTQKDVERFEVIVANLPYIAMQDRQSLAREVLHDPEVALFAGERGDELIRGLIEQVPARLNPDGLLALEIGLNQAEGLTEFLRQKNYHDIEAKKDYSGTPRFLLARYG
jgi:release factor glutamine methyltransferase